MNISQVQNHPLWIERRDAYLKAHGTTCVKCGDWGHPHVHHKYYQNGRAYWDYDDDDLEVLCVRCHNEFHAKVPITKLYTLGYEISPSFCTRKLSRPIEKLRRLVIRRQYTPEMVFNNYASEFKTIYFEQIIEFEFVLGLYTTEIIDFLVARGVELLPTPPPKIKKVAKKRKVKQTKK
jgi:hypothetical protein